MRPEGLVSDVGPSLKLFVRRRFYSKLPMLYTSASAILINCSILSFICFTMFYAVVKLLFET
jgi:hypothetical protein